MGQGHCLFHGRTIRVLPIIIWNNHRNVSRRRAWCHDYGDDRHPADRLPTEVYLPADTRHAGKTVYLAADIEILGDRVFPLFIARERIQFPLAGNVHTILNPRALCRCRLLDYTDDTGGMRTADDTQQSDIPVLPHTRQPFCGYFRLCCFMPSRISPRYSFRRRRLSSIPSISSANSIPHGGYCHW